MKISVVMATFNGSRYLLEQLESIKNQTVKADEVIIIDDCSSDGTLELVRDYISKNKLINWFAESNEHNVGWKKNFHLLLCKATGDLIFLCDQDDIWNEKKIEEISNFFLENRNAELVVTAYKVLYGESTTKKNKKNESVLISKEIKPGFHHVHYPGAVYALKKELFEKINPYWNEELPHDAQLWSFSYLRHTLYVLDTELVRYRRHDNTVTGRDKLSKVIKRRNIQYEIDIIEMIRKYMNNNNVALSKKELIILDETFLYALKRMDLINKFSFITLLGLIIKIDYYSKKRTLLGDIIVSFAK